MLHKKKIVPGDADEVQSFLMIRRSVHNFRHISPKLTHKMESFLSKLRNSKSSSDASDESYVKVQENRVNPKVIELVLHNESRRNALSGKMMVDLHDIISTFSLYPSEFWENKVGLLIYGNGGNFCAGADIKSVKENIQSAEDGLLMSQIMTLTLLRLRRLPLISVALIDGYAIGGGAELATCTDFRISTKQSTIRFVQAKMGVSTGWGGGARLTKLMGRQKALELLGTSVSFTGEEGMSTYSPFIDQVVDIEEADDEDEGAPVAESSTKAVSESADRNITGDSKSKEIENRYNTLRTERLVNKGLEFLYPYLIQPYPNSIRAIKSCVAAADDVNIDEMRQYETDIFKSLWGGQDNRDAIAALEKSILQKKNKPS